MYCVHARKGASEAPRTRFRSMKFLRACPQTPLAQSAIDADPLFAIALDPPYPLGGPVPTTTTFSQNSYSTIQTNSPI